MRETEFIKKIKENSVKPSEKWASETRQDLLNVTKLEDTRISFCGLFNFISLIQMNKSLKLTLTAFATVTALGVTGVMTAGTVNASAPGDFLYGLDRAYEVLGSTVQFSDIAKAEYQIDLLEERTAEAVVLEEVGEEDLLEEALENIDLAEEKTLERIRKAEDNENSEVGDLERIRERLEPQLEEAVKTKEQVKDMYQEKGNDAGVKNVENSIEKSKKDVEDYRDSSKVNFVDKADAEVNLTGNQDAIGEVENNSDDHDGEGSYMEQEQNGAVNSIENSSENGSNSVENKR